jgi:DNA invertase Pin-like site-specific DNA recombinase
MPTNTLYAAYLRDSGGEEQELSIEQQEKEIRAWCIQKGYILTAVFKDEARPGSSTVAREAFQAMMHHFRSGAAQEQGIIIWKFSRFARDIDDAQFYKADLRRRGYQILSMKDSVPDGLDGRFFEAAIDWMNARFLDDLSTDVKRGLRHLVSEYGGVPGTPPRGFMREPIQIGAHRDGKPHIVHKWVPDPETWDRACLAWQMREKGASYTDIRIATGNLYTTNSGIKHFFQNRIYRGELHYGDQIITDYVKPMVSEETFQTVQNLNTARSLKKGAKDMNHPRRIASNYILSGMVRCAQCGALMNGETIKNKKKNHTAHYYACSNMKLKRGCRAPVIPRRTLEKVVLDELTGYLSDPQNIKNIQEEYTDRKSTENVEIEEAKRKLTIELGTVKAGITRIIDAITDHGHNQAMLEKLTSLEQRKTELLTQQAHLNSVPTTPENELADVAARITKALRAAEIDSKRTVLRGLVDHIIAERVNKNVQGMISFCMPPKFTPIHQSHRRGPNNNLITLNFSTAPDLSQTGDESP